jgi:hypothetical protein
MRHSVCASVGGFANHYRWLLLLSEKYNNLALLNANSFMRINKAFPWKVEDKVKFIQDNIYCKERNHRNWINYEWKYRKQLDHVIPVSHNIYSASYTIAPKHSPSKPHKILVSLLDPEDCLKHYVKFNPTLNSFSPSEFLKRCANDITDAEEYLLHLRSEEQMLIVQGKELYKPTLDRNLYKSMIDFFELEDLYEYANQIHMMWYRIHNA